MYDELVRRLKIAAKWADKGLRIPPSLCLEAADAIEELQGKHFMMKKTAEWLAEKVPKWIPVTERLPKGADKSGDACENVWLLFDDGNVYPGWMNGITEKVYYLNERDDYIIQAPISRVKMWQPKPEPPKEET